MFILTNNSTRNENYWGAGDFEENSRGAGVFLLWNDQILIPMKCTKSEAPNHWFLRILFPRPPVIPRNFLSPALWLLLLLMFNTNVGVYQTYNNYCTYVFSLESWYVIGPHPLVCFPIVSILVPTEEEICWWYHLHLPIWKYKYGQRWRPLYGTILMML